MSRGDLEWRRWQDAAWELMKVYWQQSDEPAVILTGADVDEATCGVPVVRDGRLGETDVIVISARHSELATEWAVLDKHGGDRCYLRHDIPPAFDARSKAPPDWVRGSGVRGGWLLSPAQEFAAALN